MKKIMIPTTYKPYEIPEYKEYNVPNKVVEYIEYLEKQENFKLLQRIDKAIKHIETHQLCYQSQYEEMSGFDNHLLDILRGEDEFKKGN